MRLVLACLLVLSTPAFADKPSLAVLGVAAKDHGLLATANALTTAIRTQAKAYKLVGTPKEIGAAVDAAECSAIAPTCATQLGVALGADYAIAGELERRGKHQVLLLALVDVRTKQRIRSVRESVATGADPKKWARAVFGKLVDAEAGELVLVANAQQGEIWIDGQLVGALFEGRATIGGLVNGSHQLAIRAKGFRPLEIDVEVTYSTKQAVLLEPAENR